MTPIETAKLRILQRVPLADLVGQHVTLTRRSGKSVGLCPFHAEGSPSFTLYEDRYFCFGCRATGDAIDFIRHVMGFGFMDALKYLAEKFGVDAPELESSGHWRQQGEKKTSLFKYMLAAQEFYAANLRNPNAAKVREYLAGRGFTEEQVEKFGFGLAPGSSALSERGGGGNSQLANHLRRLGASDEDLIAASLGWQGKWQINDFLRGRLTIPIQDGQGRVIGFGGRTLTEEQPKYLNSKETVLFDKGRVLFGLHHAKQAIRDKRRAVIVEGYMDALKLRSQGIDETVACLGTAVTSAHLRLIEPLANTIVLLFDGDAAGQKASLRAVNVAIDVPKVDVRVACIPDKMDPDEFIEAKGAEALQTLLRESVPIFEHAVKQVLKGVGKLEVPRVVKEQFVPWLMVMSDPIQRSFLVTKIAQWTGVAARIIESELGSVADVQATKQIHSMDRANTPSAAAGSLGAGRSVAGASGSPDFSELPVRPLTSLEFEILGHLYFAEGAEVKDEQLLQRLEKSVAWDEPWNALFHVIVRTLQEGQAPAQVEVGVLIGEGHPKLFEVIEKFRLMSEAFTCKDRPKRLARLIFELRSKQLRETVSRLRQELALLGPESRSESGALIKAIQELNSEMGRT